jgi:hypothetical protein
VIWAGVSLNLDQRLVVAGILLLLLSAIMTLLLLLGAVIHPIVINSLVVVVVLGFLGIGGYVIVGLAAPPNEMELDANLLDANYKSAEKFAVSLAGHKGVPTDKHGHFVLRILPLDVHEGKVRLHVESPDGKYASIIEATLNPGPLTTTDLLLEDLNRLDKPFLPGSNDLPKQIPPGGNDMPKPGPLPKESWRFIVSGDSRNCGDVVMPAIAGNSARFAPSFYWHLGDLRAIYKIDEDIAFATANNGQPLSCSVYVQRAWPDFIDHQIAPFGNLPFYIGIGNHETIPPENEDAFKRQFNDWLDQPKLHRQRELDKEPAQPEANFHWVQGGVDFIYLNNASNFFSDDQQTWLIRLLQNAASNPEVRSVVVGMHEALPDSIANYHSMGDSATEPRARPSGENVYKALLAFRESSKKPVYVLASHSHFYMENIFDTPKLRENGAKPLAGWIVGTAGAVRYPLPVSASRKAKTDVYGYLVGTVAQDGIIQFAFQEIREADVPRIPRSQYPDSFVHWCFAHNSLSIDPDPNHAEANITPVCAVTGSTKSGAH